jgi:hypothetical protein
LGGQALVGVPALAGAARSALDGRTVVFYFGRMRKAIKSTPKKRGRPKTTGRGLSVNVRLHQPELAMIDEWAARQDDRPKRPRALWRLAQIGLEAEGKRKGR